MCRGLGWRWVLRSGGRSLGWRVVSRLVVGLRSLLLIRLWRMLCDGRGGGRLRARVLTSLRAGCGGLRGREALLCHGLSVWGVSGRPL
jgi:hypothetical protein